MNFSALNVDFSSPNFDHTLSLKRPAHASVKKRDVKEEYSLYKVVFLLLLACPAWQPLQIGTDMLLIITTSF